MKTKTVGCCRMGRQSKGFVPIVAFGLAIFAELLSSNWCVAGVYSAPNPMSNAEAPTIQVVLKSVVFTSDHGVLTDYNSSFNGSGGTVYTPRGWVKGWWLTGGANNPVSHTRGQKVTVNVVVSAKPAGMNLSLSGTGTAPGLSFPSTPFLSTSSDQSVLLTSSQALQQRVDVLNQSVSWTVAVPGGASLSIGSSGPHTIFVTWGDPGAGPTMKRVNYVCTKAKTSTTAGACADALWNAVAADTYFYTGNGMG